jgi:hypothetical protein
MVTHSPVLDDEDEGDERRFTNTSVPPTSSLGLSPVGGRTHRMSPVVHRSPSSTMSIL